MLLLSTCSLPLPNVQMVFDFLSMLMTPSLSFLCTLVSLCRSSPLPLLPLLPCLSLPPPPSFPSLWPFNRVLGKRIGRYTCSIIILYPKPMVFFLKSYFKDWRTSHYIFKFYVLRNLKAKSQYIKIYCPDHFSYFFVILLTVSHACGWLSLNNVFEDEWRNGDLFNIIKLIDKERFICNHFKNSDEICGTCDFCIKFINFF